MHIPLASLPIMNSHSASHVHWYEGVSLQYTLLGFGLGLFFAFIAVFVGNRVSLHFLKKKSPFSKLYGWLTSTFVRVSSLLLGYFVLSYAATRLSIEPNLAQNMLWIFTFIIILSILIHVKSMNAQLIRKKQGI